MSKMKARLRVESIEVMAALDGREREELFVEEGQ